MLIQFPVFFILYAVLLGLTKRGPFGEDLGYSVACSMDSASTACTAVGNYANAGFFHPAYLTHTSDLYQSLSVTRVMSSFGLDLSQSAWSEISSGLVHALPYLVMVLVVMALTYLQQQQIQRRQPKNADQNPTQQMMMKVMPVAMGFIYIIIPAGVVIYFLVSSLFRIGQQAMVTRTFYTGPNAIAIPTTATEVDDEGPKERKSFWPSFKPSEGAMPQVGKKAKQARAESFASSSDRPNGQKAAKSTGSKSAGTKTAKSKRTASQAADRPSGTPSTTQKAKGQKAKGQGSKSGPRPNRTGTAGSSSTQKSKKSADRAGDGSNRPKKSSTRPDSTSSGDAAVKRPSRSAPSRKAPGRPSGDGKSGR